MIKIKNTVTLFFFLCFGMIITLQAQKKSINTVTGTVVDATSLLPLVGVTIQAGTFSSVLTNEEGKFSIKVPHNNASIKVINPDYNSRDIALKGRNTIKITLYAKAFNTYYGDVDMPMQKKSKLSIVNSVTTLNGTIATAKNSVGQLISGELSGTRAIMRSGSPGVGANIFIRGYNTLNAETQPLFVVDGMMIETSTFNSPLINGYNYNPLSDINPKDIANITVIKDAASIYGAKGANGVILIETNKADDISTKMEFYVQGGLNRAPDNIPMMDGNQFKIYLADQLNNSGLYTASQISRLPYFNENTAFQDYAKYHNATDWQKQVFNNNYVNEYYFRVTGGDEISKYGLSVGYLTNEGIIANSNYQRFTSRFNAETSITKKLSLNTNLSVTYANRTLFDDGLFKDTSPILSALNKSPFLSPFTSGGDGIISNIYEDIDNIGSFSNPKAIVDNATFETKNYNLYGQLKFMYKITNKLNISSLIGVNYIKNREDVFLPQLGIAPSVNAYGDITFRSSKVSSESLFAIYNDTRLNYSLNIDHLHKFNFNLGTRYNQNNYENSYSTSGNSGDDQFTSLQSGDRLTFVTSGNIGNWKYGSIYANADYAFLNKYFISYNVSTDASSRFGASKPAGVFPSLGAAWLVSSENFMSHKSVIDQLKIRASYGLTGNDGIGNYNAESYFVSRRFLEGSSLVSGNIANSSIRWEETTKANLGLDLGLYNERLSFNFDFFNNVTDGLLNSNTINPIYGYKGYVNNEGQLKNRGFELSFNAQIANTTDFGWNFGGNISKYKNKITSLPGQSQLNQMPGIDATILNQEGSPIGLFYGYKTEGIYNTSSEASTDGLSWTDLKGFEQPFIAGDVKFVNTDNSDDIINEADRVVIGDPNPDFTGMFFNTFTYKKVSLSAVFTFSKGNDVYNALRRQTESISDFTNQSLAIANRWRVENQNTTIPRAVYGDAVGNSRFSDRWIEDGSYMRLKTLTLSYSPEIANDKNTNITLYVTGNNIVTFTKYLGYDPEVSNSQVSYLQGIDAGLTPQYSSLVVGIRLGL